jgi:PAS domain S-box-containing protein
MAQGVVYQDPDGSINSANPAAERILGLTLAQMQGRTSMDPRWRAIHEDGSDFPGDTHPAMVSLKTGKPAQEVMGVYHPSENRHHWIVVNAIPQFRPGEDRPYRVYTTFADITERKRVEAQLLSKNTELAALNEQKNQFLGMAAHDLRNPLAVVMARSEFVLDGDLGPLNPEQHKFLDAIKHNSEFMLKLINDLLDVSKIEAGTVNLELEPTDLAALLSQNVALNRVIAGKRDIRLELDVAADLPMMELDPSKIEQVLNNLVSNAMKFSNSGGVVNIRATRVNDRVSISVADQGPGIPPDELGKLFTAFSRTSIRSVTGEKSTGLGLLIVKRILEAHQGGIRVESEPGKGTTFFADLPVAKSE